MTRAATTISAKLDIFISGDIAIESSSENLKGRSLTCFLTIASGIFGPCAARATMNTVSSGAAVRARVGLSVMVPLIAPPGVALAADADAAGAVATTGATLDAAGLAAGAATRWRTQRRS